MGKGGEAGRKKRKGGRAEIEVEGYGGGNRICQLKKIVISCSMEPVSADDEK